MGLIDDLIGRRVYLDANVFIYAVEGHEPFQGLLGRLFGEVAHQALLAFTSELTLAEVLVWPFREARVDLARHYRSVVQTHEGLTVVPITRSVLVEAARLRAATMLKLPDAIHVATALQADCEVFLTNDARLQGPPGLEVMRLADALP
ncbi:PIN domain-containing protein [Rhodocaloribacter litoris]|uniref:type II toxin-antitoxin system VapC family toxin n=1 Tax=Rhodocaloribacter litoris TaxID=2558931 RepID=UPI0014239250|nr:PIN domain-containing protein [Rhodocaloribacter litoris]QXD14714.1 PIN domain-containing protein [Rhodocaloribacter litoris]